MCHDLGAKTKLLLVQISKKKKAIKMKVPGAGSPASVDPYLSNLKGALIKMNGFKKE